MVFTTVAPETRDGPTGLALYRCRWQVELAFKRLKSLLDLDTRRTQQNSRLGEVWIRGKWLDALVIERRAQRYATGGIDPLDRPRRLTPWRRLVIARQEVEAEFSRCNAGETIAGTPASTCSRNVRAAAACKPCRPGSLR